MSTATNVDEYYGRPGPDRLLEAESYTSTDLNVPVKLRIADQVAPFEQPLSVPSLLHNSAIKYAKRPAMRFKNESGAYETVTFAEYEANVRHTAKAFINLGLEPRHAVGVLAFNCPEWYYAALGAIYAHGVIVGIYTTNSPEATKHLLMDSNAQIVVVDDEKQMKKIHEIRDELPQLKAVIQLQGPYALYVQQSDGYYRWHEIVDMEVEREEAELKQRLMNIAINECCCLVYTSGTVGMPKGVMLSHDSITFDARSMVQNLPGVVYGHESLVSYLPLSHVAAQIVDIYTAIYLGACVYFADKDAMKGTLVKTLQYARPTRFMAVPRVYEKFQERMKEIAAGHGALKKSLANWAKGVVLAHNLEHTDGGSLDVKLAKWFVSKVKAALGLDRAKTFATAAAPISLELKKYFLSLDMRLVDGYGMSECSACHSMAPGNTLIMASVGMPMSGCETKLVNVDEESKTGEICMRGRHVFMGYINNEAKTDEVLDAAGWLNTGDVGFQDESGYLYLTGRSKEIIITAGGENIPPVHVENLIKCELPGISNVFLVGEQRKYLTVLVSIKTVVDAESGLPGDKLIYDSREWMKSLNLPYETLSEILAAGPCPVVLKSIEEGIKRANTHSISNAQKVQKFKLLPHDFSIPTGELGPTLKVRRNIVSKMYADLIESLYT